MKLHAILRILLIAVVGIILLPNSAMAQMEIDELPRVRETAKDRRDFSLPERDVNVEFFSHARERYERQQQKLSRNSLTITSSLTGNMTSMSESWREVSGGNNTFTALASFTLKHIFTKDDFKIQTDFTAKLGYTRITYEEELEDGTIEKDPIWYKNVDQFVWTVNPSMKLSERWSYGVTGKLTSQFTEGFVSSLKQEWYNQKSDFMSPGYFDLSADLIYTSETTKKIPFVITVSPLALSAAYVLNDQIIENAQYSYGDPETTNKSSYVEAYTIGPFSNSKYLGGSSVKLSVTKSFGKSKNITYTGSVYSFYGWLSLITYKNPYTNLNEYETAITDWTALTEKDTVKPMYINDPTMQWENKLTLKATKILTTTITHNMYYSKAENLKIRNQTLLNVGFSFSYKNK